MAVWVHTVAQHTTTPHQTNASRKTLQTLMTQVARVDAIQVRKFDWKADGSHQDYGMIAQELQTVAPEAVSGRCRLRRNDGCGLQQASPNVN